MSISQSWVQGSAATLAEGRTYTYILGYGYDGAGNKKGAILNTQYRTSSGGRDYFEAGVPQDMSYLSTFALAKLSGSGNLLQLITLTIASHVSSSAPNPLPSNAGTATDSESGSSSGSGKSSSPGGPATGKEAEKGAPPVAETAITGIVTTNQNGVVTKGTSIKSSDTRATVSLPEGITARDGNGNPLTSISVSPADLNGITSSVSGTPLSFDGLAYELGPDGAIFSPSAQLTFIAPPGTVPLDYTVRTLDRQTGTWQDIPTTYDPSTGIVTAQISHLCCFALFSRPVVARSTPEQPQLVTPTPSGGTVSPPSTAITIFLSMMAYVTELVRQNLLVVAVLGCLVLLLYVKGRKRRMDRIRYFM